MPRGLALRASTTMESKNRVDRASELAASALTAERDVTAPSMTAMPSAPAVTSTEKRRLMSISVSYPAFVAGLPWSEYVMVLWCHDQVPTPSRACPVPRFRLPRLRPNSRDDASVASTDDFAAPGRGRVHHSTDDRPAERAQRFHRRL